MPNHCTNLLSCTSNDLGKVLKPYMTEDGKNIDFNKILPMPEGIEKSVELSSIEIITSDNTQEAMEARKKERETLAEENKEKYGFESWYDWSVENWGTKWNAYNCWTLEEGSGLTIDDISDLGFQTAWSPPLNVIRELSRLTGETFRMSYYDEGWMFGGVFTCGSDGEQDEQYDSPEKVDPDSSLFEELDCAYFLEIREEENV